MPITNDLELPIKPLEIDGPAVRGMNSRKEENDNERVEVAKFVAAYEPIKDKVLGNLMKLAATSY